MNENSTRKCPQCGAELAAPPADALCPRCAAGFLQAVPTEVSPESGGKHAFTPPSPADLVGKFPQLEIIAFLGQGGMGAVYKARQRELDRVVALKILPPGIGEEPAFAERFAREAKALAKLNHPGIVTIYDFGRADGLFYFLMEFVDGVSLGQLIQTGRLSPREALAIVPQICDALQYAHDQGLVHRDIKPENILLDRLGRVKVADFGLVKLMESSGELAASEGSATRGAPLLTQAGKVMGTPQYMAPEQVAHPMEVDHRADIYALGVVFYQMLTGELPGKPLEPPSKKVMVDVRLDEVVLRALEREPERRYQQASQVKTAVETLAQARTPGAEEDHARGRGKSFSFLCQKAVGSLSPRFRRIAAVALVTFCAMAGLSILLSLVGTGHGPWSFFHGANLGSEELSTPPRVAACPATTGDIGVYLSYPGLLESSNSLVFMLPQSQVQSVFEKFSAGEVLPLKAYDESSGGVEVGHGSLVGMDNKIDANTGTLKCKARFQPDRDRLVLPGQYLNIRILLEVRHEVVRIPSDAVKRDKHPAFVWVLKPDQTVTRRIVQIGTVEDKVPRDTLILQRLMIRRYAERQPNAEPPAVPTFGPWAEVQSGLSPGELVVVAPWDADLHEGQKVRYDLVPQWELGETKAQTATEHRNEIPEWVKGTPLDQWISELQSPDSTRQKMAEHAIATLGTNAIPQFLKILDNKDASEQGDDLRYNAAAALRFIGPEVRCALPSFVSLLNSGNQESSYAGARALAFTTPLVPEAFAQLTNGLVDPSPGVRDAATHGVSLLLGSETNRLAEAALPVLLRNLKDEPEFVRADTASALDSFVQNQRIRGRDAKPELIIPAVLALLEDKYSYARQHAEMVLKQYGGEAIPVLNKLMNDPDSEVRARATNALQKIGRDSLAPGR